MTARVTLCKAPQAQARHAKQILELRLMKITFVTPPNTLNGGLRVIGLIAADLAARGHDIRIFAQPHPPLPLRKRLRALIRYRKILRRAKDGPFLDQVLDRITTLDRQRPVRDTDLPDADVVIATWWETAPWVDALSPAKGAKVYFMQDYGAAGQEFEKLIPTWRMPFSFITLNRRLQAMIREHNPEAPVTIMRNAVDHKLFNAVPRPRGTPPVIGVMHRKQATKGMDIAAKALSLIREQIPDLRAIAVGASRAGLPDWVELVRQPDDAQLAAVYRSCDLWLFPSRMEGFGLPIIEAMASRTPVISTRVGGAEDVIEDGINGYLVEIDDGQAMAERAVTLLAGPESTWATMSGAAHEAVGRYGWTDAVDVFEAALYQANAMRQA